MRFYDVLLMYRYCGLAENKPVGGDTEDEFKRVEGIFSRSLSVLLLKVGYMLLSVTIKLQLSAVV